MSSGLSQTWLGEHKFWSMLQIGGCTFAFLKQKHAVACFMGNTFLYFDPHFNAVSLHTVQRYPTLNLHNSHLAELHQMFPLLLELQHHLVLLRELFRQPPHLTVWWLERDSEEGHEQKPTLKKATVSVYQITHSESQNRSLKQVSC